MIFSITIEIQNIPRGSKIESFFTEYNQSGNRAFHSEVNSIEQSVCTKQEITWIHGELRELV